MATLRAANERGKANFGWLDSKHTFSFGHYHDPDHMGHSALRVINDDRVLPGTGFDTHGHRDMEILSYVLQGTIEHKDSMGHKQKITAGEFQIMSAGTGITHSEYNASTSEPLHFLQIWLLPNEQGVTPQYDQKAFTVEPGLTAIVHPTENGAMRAHTDARVYRFQGSEKTDLMEFEAQGKNIYVHAVTDGLDVNGTPLNTGDGLYIDASTLAIGGDANSEALVFDLP
jgi:redox-sensitive bicupin YhaK (pirin superfamily)